MDETIGMNIPKNFIPAIERGFQEACEHGLATGHPIVGLRMVLKDGEDGMGDTFPHLPCLVLYFSSTLFLPLSTCYPPHVTRHTHTTAHHYFIPHCRNPQLTLCSVTSLYSAASVPLFTSLLPRLLYLNLPPPHHPVKGCLILWTPVNLRSN